ncbi:MAG: bifunctional diaminohydroxyphosphoribosylaminopyrimidine deaminase/5-amino-6-(5-phosphoribosylamino)uracil reductase RibD [Gammaproteobacteria bacterium]|nr:bifunctional diaminohydroxyphosphoribosylaminopyrimidine deaminase/5-amino-6-(5-phosphoribosylamino)uracil reductase RibD [Gammaproteobacteria bacterium]
MGSVADLLYLQAAVELAERGLFSCTPNPRVGCVLVRDGAVIGRGAHLRTGEGHAEANALADAGGDASGATAYISLEPCTHTGRTPPCTRALIAANIRRVVVAMRDPDPRMSGRGLAELKDAGIRTELRMLPEAEALNAGYVLRLREGRPFVRLKIAQSLDGRTAMASGESRWITGPTARADVQYWRARSCAVITGSGTVLADDPRLTVRDQHYAVDGRLRQPLRVVTDTGLRVPGNAALFDDDAPVLFAHAANVEPVHPRAGHLVCGEDKVDLTRLLEALAERGCNEVLVEAGPRLVGAFLAENLWDEIVLYLAPKLLGSTARPMADLPLATLSESVQATIVDCVNIGGDLRVRLVPQQASET